MKQWHNTDQRVLDDHRLSWAALGLLQYLCSRPDDWTVSVSYLGKTLMRLGRGAGRDKVYALLRELSDLGYADESVKREQGRYSDHEWVIYDIPKNGFPPAGSGQEPADLPDTVPPEPAQPDPAKPTLIKTDSSTTTDSDSRTESTSRALRARKSAPAENSGGDQGITELETNPVLASIVGNLVEAVRHGPEVRDLRALVVTCLTERGLALNGPRIAAIIATVRSKAPVRRPTKTQQEART
jgi:hypothetical protein